MARCPRCGHLVDGPHSCEAVPDVPDSIMPQVPEIDPRVLRLRIELYAAAQQLTGVNAEEFWQLIAEIHTLRPQRPAGGETEAAPATP